MGNRFFVRKGDSSVRMGTSDFNGGSMWERTKKWGFSPLSTRGRTLKMPVGLPGFNGLKIAFKPSLPFRPIAFKLLGVDNGRQIRQMGLAVGNLADTI